MNDAAFWKRFLCVLSLSSLFFCAGLRFYQVRQYVGQHLAQLPDFEENKNYICIMNTDQGYYTDDLIQNDPFLKERVVMLRSINKAEDHEMIKTLFPEAIKIKDSWEYSFWEINDNIKAKFSIRFSQ